MILMRRVHRARYLSFEGLEDVVLNVSNSPLLCFVQFNKSSMNGPESDPYYIGVAPGVFALVAVVAVVVVCILCIVCAVVQKASYSEWLGVRLQRRGRRCVVWPLS